MNKQKRKYKSRKRHRKKIKRVKDGLSRIVNRSKDAGVPEEASKFLITICSSPEPQASDCYQPTISFH